MTKIGHNVGADELRSIVERIENRIEAKAECFADIREIYAEAKSRGYSVPALRQIIKIRATDPQKREEHEHTLDVYKSALGLLPLFDQENQS